MTSSGHPFSPSIKKGEVSFLRSLSFIKSSPYQEMKSSRRHSMKAQKASHCSSDQESCPSKTATKAHGPPKRDPAGDRLAAVGTQNRSPYVEFLPRTPTSEKDTNGDKTVLQTRRLSHSKRGVSSFSTFDRSMSNFTVESLPEESTKTSPKDDTESSNSRKFRSARSHKWPPPPPPRPVVDQNKVTNKNLSSMFHSSKNIELPFPTKASSSSPKLLRRNSMLEMRHWPPPPPPRAVSNQNNSKNTSANRSSMFHGSRNIELPFPTVAASSLPHLERRYSMLDMGHVYREQGLNSTNLPAAVARPSPLPGSYSEGEFRGYRSDYALGEVARSLSHMIIAASPQEASDVSLLKSHDFAFIKRTDESWTYSILSYRAVDESLEEYMVFVLSVGGSTKRIKKRQWAEYIRCVVVKEDCLQNDMGNDVESHVNVDEIALQYRQWLREAMVPENIILTEKNEEDCSLISFDW